MAFGIFILATHISWPSVERFFKGAGAVARLSYGI